MKKQPAGAGVCTVPVKPTVRVPVTPNSLADFVAGKLRGNKPWLPGDEAVYDELYRSIHKMVCQICSRYTWALKDDVNDLAQDCMVRIIRYMDRYDSRICSFTCWCWRLCSSTMNSKYRKHIHRIEEVPMLKPEVGNIPASDLGPSPIAIDIAEAVSDLAEAHPKRKKLIFEMFGNPKKNNLRFPTKVMVPEAAKAAGETYIDAYQFYSRVVRPFFMARFE